jgi:uncharacterized protein YbcI
MPSEDSAANVPQLAQISRLIMRVYKARLGRGPDRAHTHYAGPDAIVCFLEGTLTPVERTLTTVDEHERLRDLRMVVHDVAKADLRAAIEELTSRVVIASASGFDSRADVVCESFLLEPI